MKDYLTMFVEEVAKEGHSILKAGVDVLFKANGELAAFTVDNYRNNRFNIRLEDFAYEQEQLSDEAKEIFYKNITAEQLNYLFELLDKARTSTYDLHAKILAKLYGNLVLNGKLDYHETTFLANINILNDDDLLKFYSLLDDYFNKQGLDIDSIIMKNEELEFVTSTYTDLYIYEKLLRVGLISSSKIGSNTSVSTLGGKKKEFYIHNFSKQIYLSMNEFKC